MEWIQTDPFEFSAGIRTFTEQEHDQVRQGMIHEALRQAERLIFLGFSFQPQNMALMSLPNQLRQGAPIKDIYSTGVGISADENNIVTEELLRLYRLAGDEDFARDKVKIILGGTCTELFRSHRLVFING